MQSPGRYTGTLVLRLVDASTAGLRVRVIEVGETGGDRVLGVVASPSAAAALVRGWLEAAVEGSAETTARRRRQARGPSG